MSIRPLNADDSQMHQEDLIQRTKFKNPTISEMTSMKNALSPVVRGHNDPQIMQFSDSGDDYYEVPDNISDNDPRIFMCTCFTKREDFPCTCKYNPRGFNRAMYDKIVEKDTMYLNVITDEIVRLTEEQRLNDVTIKALYLRLTGMIVEDNLYLKQELEQRGKLDEYQAKEDALFARVLADIQEMYAAGIYEETLVNGEDQDP